jgi:hypothetical protein
VLRQESARKGISRSKAIDSQRRLPEDSAHVTRDGNGHEQNPAGYMVAYDGGYIAREKAGTNVPVHRCNQLQSLLVNRSASTQVQKWFQRIEAVRSQSHRHLFPNE